MRDKSRTRWAAVVLVAGTILFSLATILGEPFEQTSVSSLVDAVTANRPLFIGVNLLATVGLVVVVVGFALLTTPGRADGTARQRAYGIGLGLMVAAMVFWVTEVVFRLRLAYTGAGSTVPGGDDPILLTTRVGVGWNAIFLIFLALALAGIAVLVWGLGDAQMIPLRLARLGAGLVIGSGVLAALFYPWVGEVERALFYPLVLVVMPIAIYLLLRQHRSRAQAGAI